MHFRSIVIAFVLLALLVSSSFAITIKENEAIFKGDDPRLEQTVVFNAEGISIADTLAKLSESTGVVMNAGIDKDDWMVRDRKVIVHVSDMRLHDLMQELSTILRFHWSRGGEQDKWTYRMWQDKLQRTEEESLRTAAEDERTKKFRERRENVLSDVANLGSLSQSDAAALRDTDPWRYILATEPLGKDVAHFMNSFADARNAFVQGLEASFPVSQLDSSMQDMVRRIAESYDSLMHSIGISADHHDLLNRFDKMQVTVNRHTGRNEPEVISRNLLGQITIGSGQESFDIPIFDPSSAMAKAIGKAIVALKSGKSREDVGKLLQQDILAAVQATPDAAGKEESARDITSDPALREKIKLFEEDTIAPLFLTLKALASESKLNVVSDYFQGSKPTIAADERRLGDHLESIRKLYGSNWEKVGRTLRFRDREWFRKRTWEIPQVWFDYWVARGNETDGLQLEQLSQIANLRDEQIDNTIMNDQKLLGLGAGDAARNRQILRFYASLSKEQQKTIRFQGISASALNDNQWALLQKALATKGAAYAVVAKGSQMIQLSQSGVDLTEYTFSFHPGGNDPAVTFRFTSGLIYKPVEKDEASDK